jgi:hypothetical protein
MKQLATAYTYSPSAKTVTLTGLNVPLGYILLVVNASRGQIIYNLADPLLASSSYQQGADSVLTLNSSVDASLHAPSDSLTIFYDNGAESQMVLVQGPIGPQGPPGTTSWNGLLDKPTEFPPESHAHPITEITGLSAALAGKSSTQALAAEASTREAADLALGQRIDQALANLDPAAIDSIAEAVTTINTERTERIAADAALQTAIDGKAPASHTHTASQITDFASAVVAVSPPVDWSSLTGTPTTFAPSAHTHAISEVTGLADALAGKATAAQGEKADTALQPEAADYRGAYDNGADYWPGQVVSYNGELYIRTGEPNPGYPPGSSYWAAFDPSASPAFKLWVELSKADTVHTHAATEITGLSSFIIASAPGLSINSTIRYGDGTSTTFPIDGLVSNAPESVLVALNGVTQAPTSDYTVSEASGTITFDATPAAGTQIACTALGLRTVQPPLDPTLYLYAFDQSANGLTTYSGRLLNANRPAAPALPETATTWTIKRTTLNAAGRVLSTASAIGSWANRESLSFQ